MYMQDKTGSFVTALPPTVNFLPYILSRFVYPLVQYSKIYLILYIIIQIGTVPGGFPEQGLHQPACSSSPCHPGHELPPALPVMYMYSV